MLGFKKKEFTRCLGKVAYHKKTAQTKRNERLRAGHKCRVYACERCGLFHLTHQMFDKYNQDDDDSI